jgi:hypothetical protein
MPASLATELASLVKLKLPCTNPRMPAVISATPAIFNAFIFALSKAG